MTISSFSDRHIGPTAQDQQQMLSFLGFSSLDALMDAVVPQGIRLQHPLDLPPALSESEALDELHRMLDKNVLLKSLIGQGYYGTLPPAVIIRNVLENPGWYTAYTPYQPEISQGRLETLMNFQTLVASLTGLPVANASLLDEATAAAEAVFLCFAASKTKATTFFVSDACHPQTIEVIRTRCSMRGYQLIVGDWHSFDPSSCPGLAGVLVQYPDTLGAAEDFAEFFDRVHACKALCVTATDLLALTLLKEPGAFGADVCVGSAQRLGMPMGFGGPHAAFMSVRDDLKRKMPGRLIGRTIDATGKAVYRLALQTREQHIRRDKATSNICTAQVLPAMINTFYAIYHGADGLKAIASNIHSLALNLASALQAKGYSLHASSFFDTIVVYAPQQAHALVAAALAAGFNIRLVDDQHVGISLDETCSEADVARLVDAFPSAGSPVSQVNEIPTGLTRQSDFCTESVFHGISSETEMMRYIHRLESRDLALNEAMIPLGSCTMKLNAAAIMMPITWPTACNLHPFVPADQSVGIRAMLDDLMHRLCVITGFDAFSMQPNSGAAGEYAGLMTIRRYLNGHGQSHRSVCLIPTSAHGTNPASAAMAGLSVVPVRCDDHGNIDIDDLRAQVEAHHDDLACIMVTYPSTHGVYEPTIAELCQLVHEHGGLVYMDGANMNAQVGWTSPGTIGADICHLNLHKTFAMPHGGGGPGIGCIGCRAELADYLPGHLYGGGKQGAVAAAPWGSASIATICWMYLATMGEAGLKKATAVAILNANYVAKKLSDLYPVLYSGAQGLVAHECILDPRPINDVAHTSVDDISKRLMDFGFHAPTMSFPVPGTLMVEPTESEPKAELDRFIEAMRCIHAEISDIISGKADPQDNVLKNAPHTAEVVSADDWTHPYPRSQAAYPVPSLRKHKFWPYASRVDNVYGDRNLVCTCDPWLN
jgi:glycine dehydrogenase